MNPDDFKSRSKSVFDSLASLESVHNVKAKEYIDRTLDTFDLTEENEEKRSSTAVKRKDGEFKVPEIPPPLTICGPPRRSNFTPATSGGFKRRHNEPDHVRNPHKWKRYSLEDVKESDMSSSANIRAAMSFLNRSEKHEIDQNELKNIEFNRPIGKKRGDTREEKQPKSSTKSSLILDKVEEVEEKDESESPSKSEKKSEASGFKKKVAKSARKVNLRRNDDDEEVEPNEVEMTSSLATNKRSKEEDDDDEFKEYRNEKKNDDETSEFDDNYY